MSASKQKGTGGEREVKRRFEAAGYDVDRTAPGWPFDMRVYGPQLLGLKDNGFAGPGRRALQVLTTRPDRGRWLATVDLDDLIELMVRAGGIGAQVETKRYRRFAHHTIFEETF